MTRLNMQVEGQSEEIFVKHVLAPHLAFHGVYVRPTILYTRRLASGGGYRGGVSNWTQIVRNLRDLGHDRDAWLTTLIDFYGLPEDFPGLLQVVSGPGQAREKVIAVQEQLATAMNLKKFIPFLALHEFEAWLFSAPEIVAIHFDRESLAQILSAAVEEAGSPEQINHGKATHPKARLKAALAGSYKETSDGPTLLHKIGLARIRTACPHFNGWLQCLEGLGKI